MSDVLDYQPVGMDEPRQRRPVLELLILAGPTVAQMASYTVMQFIDAWMLSKVGSGGHEPTAAGVAGMFAFSVISLGMGVLWVVNTMVSQNFGQRDFRTCGRYLWQGIWFSLGYSVLLLPVLPFSEDFFRWQGHPQPLAGLEGEYFRIVLGLACVKMIGATFGQFLLAVNRPLRVFLASICGVGVNAIVGAVLIFGWLGVKPMGVAGAAWGQNIGVAVETAVLICFALTPYIRKTFSVLDWRPRRTEMKTLLRVGIPSGVQIVADVLAWSLFGSVVMHQFGEVAVAANNYMMRYMVVSFMPALGLSTAVTALVGRYIGMGRPDIAAQRANLGFLLTAAYMLSCGLLFFLGRDHLIRVFTADERVLKIGAMLLVFAAIYQFFDAMYIVYNGALRGAGDTFVPAVATGVLNWGITICGGYMVARLMPGWGPAGPWTAATVYGMTLGVFLYARFLRGRWKLIALEDDSPSNLRANSAKLADS